jgi:predicted alpha/beta hydrolase
VIINSATSVRCRYYSRFASFLFGEGFDVITYDYRGIGESRPVSLRGFDAGWIDMQAVTIRRLRVRHALHEGHPVVLREPLATVAQY